MMQGKEKDKNRTAIALEYNPDESEAPKVIASGKGLVADKIIEEAKKADVPVHKHTYGGRAPVEKRGLGGVPRVHAHAASGAEAPGTCESRGVSSLAVALRGGTWYNVRTERKRTV